MNNDFRGPSKGEKKKSLRNPVLVQRLTWTKRQWEEKKIHPFTRVTTAAHSVLRSTGCRPEFVPLFRHRQAKTGSHAAKWRDKNRLYKHTVIPLKGNRTMCEQPYVLRRPPRVLFLIYANATNRKTINKQLFELCGDRAVFGIHHKNPRPRVISRGFIYKP
jgi:hypothetical protein